MEILQKLIENWVIFVIALVLVLFTVYVVLRFLKLTPKQQLDKVKTALLYMVTEAEKGDGKTTGTEIYVTTAEKTVGVETKIVQAIAAFGLKNRGVKRTNFTVIYRAKAAGVSSALLETCFIDDKDDMTIYSSKKAQIAEAIANAIASQFGLKKTANTTTTTTTAAAVKEIKAGSVVTIKDGAVYGGLSSTRGKAVPAAQRGGKKHTVDKVQTNKGTKEAKLKEINSWVAVASLTAV